MKTPKFQKKDVAEMFRQKKVLVKDEMLRESGCSTITMWRILNSLGYITSYNCNATFYTLADIPKFDRYGLWSYRKARFSRYGTLSNTITALVCESLSGMEVGDLHARLGVKVAPILTRLYQQGRLSRERTEGRYVYVDTNEENRKRQLEKRRLETLENIRTVLPELERVVAVLVELIQKVELKPRQIVRRLARKGVKVKAAEVQAILIRYQLDSKKKHY